MDKGSYGVPDGQDLTPVGGGAPVVLLVQRIFDTGAGWCHYTQATFNPTPLAGETTPNHTDNLVAASHAKIGEA